MTIAGNLSLLNQTIPPHVSVVAVSKRQPVNALLAAYACGQRVFGENKVQELVFKHTQLPADIAWHFIGHLQTNKVRYIAPFVRLIHSIDSLHLLQEVDKESKKHNRVVDCLLQFKIAREETKYGMELKDAASLLQSAEYDSMKNIRITGVMGMGSFSDDHEVVRKEFQFLTSCFRALKADFFSTTGSFEVISMGMSGDYLVAIEEGSTMVRIGTSIFGVRTQ